MSDRIQRLGAALVLAVGLWVGAPPRADAVSYCGGENDTCSCGQANFCICCSNATYGTDHGNCVWYGWHMACCEWAENLPFCRNAEFWDDDAVSYGYTVLGTPCERTVFVCELWTSHCNSGGYGHVGWVDVVHTDGSIDVREQGCYSWWGVQTRNFNASAASPAMSYIYEPGVTSCVQCDCTPGQVDSNPCSMCGTDTRTCGSDCLWGSWSGCQGQGVCESGQTQGCGSCGGTQTCESNCQWGACVETCPDASVPQPDAFVPTPDGGVPGPDAGAPDGGLPPGSDGGVQPGNDGGPTEPSLLVTSGCACTASEPPPAATFGLFLLLLFLLRRRRP